MTNTLRRSGARTGSTLSMSRSVTVLVGGVLLASGLSACSDESGPDKATDPGSSPSASQTPDESPSATESTPASTETPDSPEGGTTTIPVTGGAGIDEATLVSATMAGGRVETLAAPLSDETEVADFGRRLDGEQAAQMTEAIGAEVANRTQGDPGVFPWGTVVAVGCDAPESVEILAGEAGYEVTAKMPAETVQCIAPMTYVVIFAPPAN